MSVRIITGDALTELAKLPAESVHCCVTSPPYFGLRDYGTASWEGGDPACDHTGVARRCDAAGRTDKQSTQKGSSSDRVSRTCLHCGAQRIDAQLGLEATPDEYVAAMVGVFREVRRVLRSDGTLWLNIGDSYASSPPGNKTRGVSGASTLHGINNASGTYRETLAAGHATKRDTSKIVGIKPKDMIGIPWLLAFALRADGWWLRQDIIWSKPNPMPESVTDRCTKAHEYLFLMTKSERYHYDAEAIKEAGSDNSHGGTPTDAGPKFRSIRGDAGTLGVPARGRAAGNKTHKFVTEYEASDSEEHRTKAGLMKIADTAYPTRNRRSVWTIATAHYPDAHFATFPPDLVEPCILAGCPAGGTVLDPFFGAGTTALVADRLGLDCIGIELNPKHAAMAHKRLIADAGMFASVKAAE